jgi:hypothetical protein
MVPSIRVPGMCVSAATPPTVCAGPTARIPFLAMFSLLRRVLLAAQVLARSPPLRLLCVLVLEMADVPLGGGPADYDCARAQPRLA